MNFSYFFQNYKKNKYRYPEHCYCGHIQPTVVFKLHRVQFKGYSHEYIFYQLSVMSNSLMKKLENAVSGDMRQMKNAEDL